MCVDKFFGYTPLHSASLFGRVDYFSALLKSGADPTLKDDVYKHTCLHVLSENGNIEAIKLVLDHGIDINFLGQYSKIPLIYACEKGENETAELLLDRGAAINTQDTLFGNTALMYACQRGSKETISLLLRRGADPSIKNKDGKIALGMAPTLEIQRMLRESETPKAISAIQSGSPLTHESFQLLSKTEEGRSFLLPLLQREPALWGVLRDREEILSYILVELSVLLIPEIKQLFTPKLLACLSQLPSGPSYLLPKLDAHPDLWDVLREDDEMTTQLLANLSLHLSPAIKGLMTPSLIRALSKGLKSGEYLLRLLDQDPSLGSMTADPQHLALSHAIHKKWMDLGVRIIKAGSNFSSLLWAQVVQDASALPVVKAGLERNHYSDSLCDSTGRPVYQLAVPEIKKAMDEYLLWFGRYKLLEERPDHKSATCFVFKAFDEQTKQRVALKLMVRKDQFLREVRMREDANFEEEHVIGILAHHPANLSEASMAAYPDQIEIGSDPLSKSVVESMFAIALPLADRNLFVATKQERFAGKDWDTVKYVCKDLLNAVAHVHSKGIIHADLKPLNLVRVGADWRLIDFDAACRIGVDHTGLKSSTAFCPPESIYVDRLRSPPVAMVKAEANVSEESVFGLLVADPSFDVWSLGCVFYTLFTDSQMLFVGGQDDNLRADMNPDSLFDLEAWPDSLKTQKLSLVEDPLARNLLSQMLMKDSTKRPSLARILAHPFFTGREVARLGGQKATYDVFISYRVWSDKDHVKKLYESLTSQGLKVYWDARCLEDGQNWEEGFCSGVVDCRFFVPVLSRDGLSNFSSLDESSKPCDNVLLEHRLALELKEMGLVEGIFPIVMGEEIKGSEPTQMTINWKTLFPVCHNVCVEAVEAGTCTHLANQALGTPLHPNRSVLSVLSEIKKMQGALIDGDYEAKMSEAAGRIVRLVQRESSLEEVGQSIVEAGSEEACVESGLSSQFFSEEEGLLKDLSPAVLKLICEREKALLTEIRNKDIRIRENAKTIRENMNANNGSKKSNRLEELLFEKDRVIEENLRVIEENARSIQEKDQTIQEKDRLLLEKDRQIQELLANASKSSSSSSSSSSSNSSTASVDELEVGGSLFGGGGSGY